MVDYIGIAGIQRIVGRMGPAAFMAGLANEIQADYRRWADFDKSARHAIHSPVGVIELMPTSDGRMYSFKYVNGHPKNTALGLLTVTTALRTAAMSALAAKHLARQDSRVMALIGNGAQSEFQAIAFVHMLGIRELRLYDIDVGATAKLANNLKALPLMQDVRIVRCASTLEAVQGADIVTTVTADKRCALILSPDMIQPGMHLNAVGGDCPGKTELHADILLRPDAKVIVEFEPQSRIEGEIQQLPADFAVTEFAQLLKNPALGRTAASDVTIFDSVGFALEDYSALSYLYKLQNDKPGQPQKIDLIPDLLDPKNLFGLLAVPQTALAVPTAPMLEVSRPHEDFEDVAFSSVD